tara:strand:- start:323 stop:481 length:159 start_codon:yes stop_codon:yes gene_type:complete
MRKCLVVLNVKTHSALQFTREEVARARGYSFVDPVSLLLNPPTSLRDKAWHF